VAEGRGIAIEALCKSYGGDPALSDVNLVVAPGEVACLIGPSGAGKSTLLRCIAGLEPFEPDGAIRIGALRVPPNGDLTALRGQVGMVFQAFHLFPHLTVLDNVSLAPRRVLGLDAPAARARAVEVLGRMGVGELAARHPAQLSGGQQQRVAIARALAMEPRVLLFDEPTSALDPERVGEVLTVLRALAAEGVTLVVVTHAMAFARALADRVVFMERGRVVEQGSPEQLFERPEESRTRSFLNAVLVRTPGTAGEVS
jgi:polar amino acid transport system ATP-binding protein/general L-amino acid transport system ATP-binding protein